MADHNEGSTAVRTSNLLGPLSFAVLAVLTIISCTEQSSTSLPQRADGRQLVWHDEFDGEGLPDATKWGYDVGSWGWGNNELQHYTERRAANARVTDGHLIIEAHREPFDSMDYTSARLVTRDLATWSGGYIEARAKLPTGRGTWPAIWMLGSSIGETPWPRCGEIDIMEHVGYAPDTIYGTIHSEAYNHMIGTQKSGEVYVPDAETAFHTYAVDWRDTVIRFLVDDIAYHEVVRDSAATIAQWPFDDPHYLLINLAVGGNWGGKHGVDTTVWPQRMEVDWVRVWQ